MGEANGLRRGEVKGHGGRKAGTTLMAESDGMAIRGVSVRSASNVNDNEGDDAEGMSFGRASELKK